MVENIAGVSASPLGCAAKRSTHRGTVAPRQGSERYSKVDWSSAGKAGADLEHGLFAGRCGDRVGAAMQLGQSTCRAREPGWRA
ncbi:MAG: hypothetical protein J0H43_01995 [Actinobacteria bacterium]|nr:hypothetical protein [Actinomycetota bacterium]